MFGYHASISPSLKKNIDEVIEYGGKVCQIFTKSPTKLSCTSKLNKNICEEVLNYSKEKQFKIYIHCSYLINLSKRTDLAIDNVCNDLKIGNNLGCYGCVIHMGKSLKLTRETAIEEMCKSITEIINKSDIKSPNKLLLENSAHQGTEIGYEIEEIGHIYNKLDDNVKKHIGFCIDTCHAFAAGYDLRKVAHINNFISKIDKNLGWDNVELIHLNDSKKHLGCHVDRHAPLLEGYIYGEQNEGDIEGLKYLVNYLNGKGKSIVLETKGNYKEELLLLNKLKE